MNIRSTRAVIALAAVLAAAAGCGKKSETVTMKTSDGKVDIAVNESGVALPADFPKDVPLLKEAVVKAVMGTSDRGNLVVMLSAAKPFAEVAAFYQQSLKEQGWSTESSMNTGEGAMSTHKKAGRDLMLTVAKDGKDTNIQITLPHRQG